MAKNKKVKSTHGIKTRAGQLLSQYLRTIAEEETEFVKGEDGKDRMATKAEALARKIWASALGTPVTEITDDGKTITTHPRPDKALMRLLFDRIEGKIAMADDTKKKSTIADKVSEQGKKRISKAGGINAGS